VTRINPCHGCPLREGCDLRETFRERTRLLGDVARSVTFRCKKLADALRPGRRVLVPTPRPKEGPYSWGGDPDIQIESVAVPATITGSHDNTFSCVIDEGNVFGRWSYEAGGQQAPDERFRFRKSMRHTRVVRFLDEPDRRLCEMGKRVMKADGTCDKPDDWPCYCKDFHTGDWS